MKRIFTLISAICIYASASSQIIAGWSFDGVTTTNTGTAPIVTVGAVVADYGALTTGSAFAASHTSATTVWSNPAGNGGSTAVPSKSLSSNGWGVGDYYQFQASTTSYTGIFLTWDQMGSGTGPKNFKIQYSINGTTFIDVPTTITNSTYAVTTETWSAMGAVNAVSVRSADLSSLTALDNASVVYFRFVMVNTTSVGNGTVATAGTGRVDNVIISSGAVVPLKLTSFNTSIINNAVALNWATANEVNVKGFSVQKSTDGTTFNEVVFVDAKGASAYAATDVLSAGVTYYRLKMIDRDGSFAYSKIVPVSNKSVKGLSVFPNPAVSGIAVVSHAKASGKATLQVVDLNGRRLATYAVQTGATQTSVDVSALIKGNYFIVYQTETEKQTLQFSKN